jgi:hypothetical protein
MAYATIADFRNKFPRYEVTDDTAPSIEDVEAQLDNYSSQLDSVLSQRGYTVPMTESDSQDFLRAITLVGTGWWYVRTCFPNATGGLVDELRREWEWFLQGLAMKTVEVPGGTLNADDEAISFITASADADDIEANDPFVTRKQQF